MASFTADPAFGEVPLAVNFNASGSDDADGSIVSSVLDFTVTDNKNLMIFAIMYTLLMLPTKNTFRLNNHNE